MTIENIETKDLAAIVAGLVKQGLTFKCQPMEGHYGGGWKITLTGGF